jgi:hypothetical protein
MNTHRMTAIALTTCAAGLSLAACTAGITTPTPTPALTSRSPAASHTASSGAAVASQTSPAPAASADTISVDATVGTFPIPHGAQVLFNSACDKQVIIELSAVTPAQASSFYTSELPREGYKITGNTLLTGTGTTLPGSAAEIEFTGHGYKGTIAALSNLGGLASMGASPTDLPSSIAKNFLTILLTPPGTAGCAAPTGS